MFWPASKQHAFVVPPGIAGGAVFGDCTGPRSRVRQRPPSSCLLQTQPTPGSTMSMMVGVIPPTPREPGVSSRNSGGGGRGRGGSGGGGVNGGADGGGVVEQQPRGKRDAVRSGQTKSKGQAYKAQQRMLAAGKRRRWTEVLEILEQWEKHAKKLDVKTYNVAMSVLGKCGRWTAAVATLDRMRAAGVSPDVYSFNAVISAYGRAGKWQKALLLLKEMERDESTLVHPDLYSYNGAINAVAKAGRWQEALELLTSIKATGLVPDVISYTSAMSACDRAGEWKRALDIMDLMLEVNVQPNIVSYGAAISACARGGRWQKALSLLEEIPSAGLTPNAHVYGSAVHACVVGGEPRRGLAVLNEMIENGVVPDAAAFTVAMSAVDGWAGALRLLEVMKREGVMPDVVAYNTALSVVARSGREDVALAILDRMRIDGYSPDLVSFNTAIDACAAREKWEQAVQLLEVDMLSSKVKPDVITFTSVIHACAGPKGNWEKAYQLLDSMWHDPIGAKPNKRTYDLVIQACGHGGEWELGVTLLDDMRDLGIKADAQTFNIATAACARSGERLAAETLVANMWRSGVKPDEFTYASLVTACGRAGEWKRATEIFDEARYVHQIRPTLQIYGALLSSLAGGQRWADVLTYLDRMIADGVAPDAAATNTGVLAAASLGDGRKALSLLEGDQQVSDDDERGAERAAPSEQPKNDGERLVGTAVDATGGAMLTSFETEERDGVEEQRAKVGASGRPVRRVGGWEAATLGLLNTVLHSLDSQGEDAAVLEAVDRAREKGLLLNGSTYRCALKACGNLGDYRQASAVLSRMSEESVKPDIIHWNHALRASAAGARWREASSHIQAMQSANVNPDAFSYTMALKACTTGLGSSESLDEDVPPRAQESSGDLEQRANVEHPLPCRGMHAVELLREMEASGLDVCGRSFTLAMSACLGANRDWTGVELDLEADRELPEVALSLFDRLVEAGVTPTTLTYALALKACARTANSQRAFSLFFSALDASSRARPPSPATSDSSSSSSVQAAADSLQKSPPPITVVRPWHLTSAIVAYDAAGDWDGAQHLWYEALRRGVSPRGPGYSAVVAAAVRAGDVAAASRLVEEARGLRLEFRAQAFRSIVSAFQGGGKGELAEELLEDAQNGRVLVV